MSLTFNTKVIKVKHCFIYRKEKIRMRTGGSPTDWELYNDVESLLGSFESSHTDDLVADSMNSK